LKETLSQDASSSLARHPPGIDLLMHLDISCWITLRAQPPFSLLPSLPLHLSLFHFKVQFLLKEEVIAEAKTCPSYEMKINY
jgi:hypothetical protein